MGKPTDLVQGTLDFLILKAVELEPKHGWAIARRIQQVSGDVLKVPQGSLYPALYRLEKQGWLVARVGPTETGRQVKFYALTSAGRAHLRQRDRRLGTAVGCDQPRDPRHLRRRPERRLDMRWFHVARHGIRSLLGHRAADRQIDDDIAFHLEAGHRRVRARRPPARSGAPRRTEGVRRSRRCARRRARRVDVDLVGTARPGSRATACADSVARRSSPWPSCCRSRSASAAARRSSVSSMPWCSGRCRCAIPARCTRSSTPAMQARSRARRTRSTNTSGRDPISSPGRCSSILPIRSASSSMARPTRQPRSASAAITTARSVSHRRWAVSSSRATSMAPLRIASQCSGTPTG